MDRDNFTEHPGLEILTAYACGCAEDDTADRLEQHLDSCLLCRLEVKRIRRFQRIGSDRELAEEANWSEACFKLERALKERILPTVAVRKKESRQAPVTRLSFNWLAPIAAAAAVILIFLAVERSGISPGFGPGFGPMRGEPVVEYGITLEAPLGEIERVPEQFSWHPRRENEYYSIEIFTADLTQIYWAERIEDSTWVVPDSLATILEPDSIYLWNIKGYKGLEEEALSPNGWFKVNAD
ncbi:MAG: hypothetical protein JSV33_03045 [bacterium]|nr:MAG: hypothetical protein JSV33_03045 [bacterium]